MPLACAYRLCSRCRKTLADVCVFLVDRYKKVIHDFLAGVCGQQYVQDIQESPYYRKPRVSPPLNQDDIFNSMAFVENVYSPGTFAMNGVNNTPQM